VAPGTYEIHPLGRTDLVIPPNITLELAQGARLAPAAGKTLVIKGNLKAGRYRIFGGSGEVVLDGPETQFAFPQWWGARADGAADDTLPLAKAVAALQGKGRLVLPRGTYRVGVTHGWQTRLCHDLTIEGQEGAVLTVERYAWSVTSPRVARPELRAPARRRQNLLSVSDSRGIKPGDLVHLRSRQVGETAWKTPKQDIGVVAGIPDGRTIRLATPLNFSYIPQETGMEVLVHRPRRLTLANLTFKPNLPGSAIDLQYLRPVEITTCKLVGSGLHVTHQTGIRTQGCVDVAARDLIMEHIYYGIAPCFTRNFRADNTVSRFCRHPYTPAAFSDQVVIRNLFGWQNEATMDSHPAFNVHYDGVRAFDGLNQGVSCLRCVGGKITNSYFHNPLVAGAGRFHTVALADMAIYKDYAFVAENVVWDTPNAAPGELWFGPLYGGRALLRQVTAKHLTVSAAAANQIGEAILENCQYDQLYCRNRHTLVRWPERHSVAARWEAGSRRYLIDPRKEPLFRSNQAAFLKGPIFTGEEGGSISKRVKIKTFINFYPGGGAVLTEGALKLTGTLNPEDGSSPVRVERRYRFQHHYVAASWVKMAAADGQAPPSTSRPDQSLRLEVGDLTQKGASETQDQKVDEWGVEFTVRLATKYPRGRADLSYELALSAPEDNKP